MFQVSGSLSTRTGVAPERAIWLMHRNNGEGGEDDLIAWSDAEGGDGRIQGGSAIADRDTVLRPLRAANSCLEAFDEGALGGNPAGIDALGKIFLFIAVEQGLVDGIMKLLVLRLTIQDLRSTRQIPQVFLPGGSPVR